MNPHRITTLIALLLIAAQATAIAATPAADSYESRKTRAERYFKYKEWSSALAMYLLMLDERPDEVEPYYKAIVAGAMNNDSITQIDMLERTQQRGISLDSLFNGVRSVSFSIGEAGAYNNFLLLVKKHQPWLNRRINIYLLEYYDFRNDATNVIKTARQLLSQTPRNIGYMKTMARAYINIGDLDKAMECYKRILAIDGGDYDSLLALGNYYAMQLLQPSAIKPRLSREDLIALTQTYLHEAYNLYPTPYVAQLLAQVNHELETIQQ